MVRNKNVSLFVLLLRLPVFIASHAFIAYLCKILYERDAVIASYLLIFPFISLFLIDELVIKKTVKGIFMFCGVLLWMLIIYILSGVLGFRILSAFLCLACGVYFLYFLSTNPYQYEKYKFTNAAGLCFIFFIICGSYLRIEAARIFFIDGVIIAALSQIGAHVSMLNHFIDSFACRGKSRKTITALLSRNYRFIATAALFIVMLGAAANMLYRYSEPMPKRPVNMGIELNIEREALQNGESIEPHGNVIIEELEEQRQNIVKDIDPFRYLRIVLTVLSVALIPVIIYFLIKLNIKHRVNSAEFEDFEEDVDSGYEFSTHKKKNIRLAEHGVNRTIRRMFYKKVNEHRRRGLIVKRSHTARNISDSISRTENISALGDAYQKARYSGKELERSEIRDL